MLVYLSQSNPFCSLSAHLGMNFDDFFEGGFFDAQCELPDAAWTGGGERRRSVRR
jgi:hypothetical protein